MATLEDRIKAMLTLVGADIKAAQTRGDVYAGGDPRDQGLLAWTLDPILPSSGATLTTGLQYFVKVMVPRTITITSVMFGVSTVGATLTAGANNIALYDSTGARIAATADITTDFTTAGVRTVAFTSPVVVTGGPGVYIWVGVKSTGTTPVSLHRYLTTTVLQGVNLTASQYRIATQGTVTNALMPASVTPSSMNGNYAGVFWFGLK